MEVFLQNVPSDLTDHGLKEQLTRFTKALSIHDWSCQKPRRRRFGFMTFLHAKDGERFLSYHQRQTRLFLSSSGDQEFDARFVMLGKTVRCERSRKFPDEFHLKSLAKSAEERLQIKQSLEQPKDTKIIFSVLSLSSGYYEHNNGELGYTSDVEWASTGGFAKFAKREIIIEFGGQANKQRIEIPYRIVEAMIISTQPTALTFTLWEAPRLFSVTDPALVELMTRLSMQSNDTFTSRTRLVRLKGGIGNDHEALGLSLVYRICVSPVDFDLMTRKLHDRAFLTIHNHNLAIMPLYRWKILGNGMTAFIQTIQECSAKVPFTVLYQMEALVRNGFLPPRTVQRLLVIMVEHSHGTPDPLHNAYLKSSPITVRAIKQLFLQIPFPGPDVNSSVFDANEIWAYLLDNEKELSEGVKKDLLSEKARQNLTLVHRVNITPTGMILHGPEPEAKNRILRRFPDHIEYFIRVQFCEEDGADLRFNSKVSNDDVFKRFKDVFNNGINIGGRVYSFLGFSHSSLRNHTAWFMAPFVFENKLQTYFSIISYLGDFQHITSPARCAARIGQAFSETPLAVALPDRGITPCIVPDVESADGSRVFSDGVGTISQSVMEYIHVTIPQRKVAPTCFQIRWGGAKGMLSLDPRLEGYTMRVRPSMIKFQSTDTANLEICDMANKPIPMVLNRQMIKLLEDMGVSDGWFFQQQEHRLNALRLITAHIANTVNFLDRQNIADKIEFPRFLRRLDSIGIDYKRDQFMSSIVEATVLRELRLLKHKARIPVAHGVTLFGIMDETGYLDEGEVYVTFDKAAFIHDRAGKLDNCRMIITRSPALHPGDIQLATNVIPHDHHPLRSQKNCIVFSQKGQRDLPSCLNGGDLDGDIYGIIWDTEAVHGCTRVFEPADYPRAQQVDIGRQVQREDMSDFFIQFMKTDQLGVIANRHMILADQKDLGTLDPDCKQLAEIHSTGVDYSKTGIPVDLSLLKKIKVNRYRPDFLSPAPLANIKDRTEICFDTTVSAPINSDEDDRDGPTYLFYKSDKINGKLYRAIDEGKIWFKDIKINTTSTSNIWTELLQYLGDECSKKLGGIRWASEKAEAWEIRSAYEDAISNAACEYSDHATKAITELEVFTGSIFNKTGVQTRRQRDGSARLKDEFDRIVQWTVSMIHKGSHQSRTSSKASLALSMACLAVGCMAMQRTSSRLETGRFKHELESFRVVAACCAVRHLDAALSEVS